MLTPGHGDSQEHRRAHAEWQRRSGFDGRDDHSILGALRAQDRAQAEAGRAERERAEHHPNPAGGTNHE